MSDGLPDLRVLPADAIPAAAAAEIVRVLAAAVEARGVAHWATTGGSSAPGIYRELRGPVLRDALDWSRVHTWWGDDRYVPPDHPLSNVLPLDEILVAGEANPHGVAVPAGNLHPVPVPEAIARAGGPAWAAARYDESLREGLPADAAGTPVLDLVVLGVGPDGHILSVFPGSAAWDAAAACVAVPAPTHIEPHVERVTLHPRMVAAARVVLVATAGAAKAAPLGRAWAGADPREVPVAAAHLPGATWILDEAAAAGIPRP